MTKTLGFLNQGGTLGVNGLTFANRCTWAHVLLEIAVVLALSPDTLLDEAELAAVEGRGDPTRIWSRHP